MWNRGIEFQESSPAQGKFLHHRKAVSVLNLSPDYSDAATRRGEVEDKGTRLSPDAGVEEGSVSPGK